MTPFAGFRAKKTNSTSSATNNDDQIVRLNIGGSVFQTSRATLTKFDGFFKALFETELSAIRDDSGAIFVDRDPKHFRLILNFMRDGDVAFPESKQEIEEILKEAQFYLLKGLIKLCDELRGGTKNHKKLRFIESEEEFLQIITEPEKPVLVFHTSPIVFGKNRYPFGLNVEGFLEKYKDQFDVYFKPQEIGPKGEVDHWRWTIHEYNQYQEGKDPLNWNMRGGLEEDIKKWFNKVFKIDK
uniref:BTB domain-containing protein n=1 Tax=Caenorhabditis tropicalis TaxID=1561998 RepID=A0A1I7TCK7_9PELO